MSKFDVIGNCIEATKLFQYSFLYFNFNIHNMKTSLTYSILCLLASINTFSQKPDTVSVDSNNLQIKNLNFGNFTYAIYANKGIGKPIQNQTVVKVNVSKHTHEGNDAVAINQVWYENDTVSHTAMTLLKASDLSTIKQNHWWKRTGQSLDMDFVKKTANIEGKISQLQKDKIIKDFNTTIEGGYFLNWHCDIQLFPLLPFNENAVFKIKVHDPGFRSTSTEIYTVIKSEVLKGLGGENIDCWVMEYPVPKGMTGYQRFWISKKTREFIKEEDKIGEFYRIKLRMVVSENN